MRYLLIFLIALSANAATLTVCASGCDYTSLASAVTAAANGDTIEIEPGYANDPVNFRALSKSGITVRSRGWSQPYTKRVTEADKPRMAIIRSTTSASAMELSNEESVVAENGVDLANDTITFSPAFDLANDVPVYCFTSESGSLPAPLDRTTIYYLRDYSAGTGKLAATVGGAAIDLTTVGSAADPNYFTRPRCTNANVMSDWTFEGLFFEGTQNAFFVVTVGKNMLPVVAGGPNRITFKHNIIENSRDVVSGSRFGLAILGGFGHVVYGNRIVGPHETSAGESKGIWLQNTRDVLIENNDISAASINILTAGNDAASRQVVTNVTIRNNYIFKPGWMFYKEGSGAPSGACYYGDGAGAFYRDTAPSPNTCANGACYECQANGTWAQNLSALYRNDDYLTKNLLELKDCENCYVTDNRFNGSYVGPDSGQGGCYAAVAGTGTGFGSGYHKVYNVRFERNWCSNTYAGIAIVNGNIGGGAGFDQLPVRDVVHTHNLISDFAQFPALSQYSAVNSALIRCYITAQGQDGVTIENNTCRPAAGMTSRNAIQFNPGAWPAAPALANFNFRNNIGQFDGSNAGFNMAFPPATTFNCSATGFFLWSPSTVTKRVANNILFGGTSANDFITASLCTNDQFTANSFAANDAAMGFESASDSRLDGASAYIAAGTDGTVPGADIDAIDSGAGQAINPISLQNSKGLVTKRAVSALTWTFEDRAAACTVGLYANRTDRQRNQNALSAGSDTTNSVTGVRTITRTDAATVWWKITCAEGIMAGTI